MSGSDYKRLAESRESLIGVCLCDQAKKYKNSTGFKKWFIKRGYCVLALSVFAFCVSAVSTCIYFAYRAIWG